MWVVTSGVADAALSAGLDKPWWRVAVAAVAPAAFAQIWFQLGKYERK
jgi:hypothetical protein